MVLYFQVKGGTISNYGKPSQTVSTVYLYQLLLTKRYSVAMEVSFLHYFGLCHLKGQNDIPTSPFASVLVCARFI